jgi:hypothetical protein
MHSFTEMVRQLRDHKGTNGLVLANGGVATYQHVVILSSNPRADGSPYPQQAPLPEYVDDLPVPQIAETPEGEAVIETYTVEFNRDGTPLRGHIVGRLKQTGHRFLANHGDASTLDQLCSTSAEPIGRTGYVKGDPAKKGRNLFSFARGSRL